MNRAKILEFISNIDIPGAQVKFETDDRNLDVLFDKAESAARQNIQPFSPRFKVMVEMYDEQLLTW